MAFKIRKDLAYRRVGGELFVVDAAGARLHELNGTAAIIWEGLDKGLSEAELAAGLAGEFEVGEAEARADVKEFVSGLRRAGLLEEK
ncbi:MAG: PqqD family protein [Elusimicrobia bacterium]|nr:PqqD family protein [Elusimicrobiota bacterium]